MVVELEAMEQALRQHELLLERLNKIKCKIAVMSGKGGVGKTFLAVHLAALLAGKGKRVGLLDADIDCPNVYSVLGIEGKMQVRENELVPVEKYGIKIASMAGVQEEKDSPLLFRGPVISSAIRQFVGGVAWGELDYLFIDMPPGTSDAALTLMQLMKLDGIVIVSAPGKAAVLDARKAFRAAVRMGQPVLGFVENMQGEVFGSGKVEAAACELKAEFLGGIPLLKEVNQAAAEGRTALEFPEVKMHVKRIAAAMEKALKQ